MINTHPKMWFRNLPVLLKTSLTVLVTYAGLINIAGMAQEGVIIQQLTVARATIWASPVIPVCWENPGSVPSTELAWVTNVVANTWERHSRVRFQGWGTCQSGSRGIRIEIKDIGPHVKEFGKKLDGMENGMVLNFSFANWSQICAASNNRKSCIEKIAVHEFGHALGFAHEQNRPDSPDWCREQHQGTDGDIYLTPYDRDSVMNYCNPSWNNNGFLSALDISGLQQFYGVNQSSGQPWEANCRSQVILFEHINFGGRKFQIRGSDSSLVNNNFNDIASSLCVPPGYRLILFEHTGFQGKQFAFDGPINILDLRVLPGSANFHDQISSYKLMDLRLNMEVYEAPPECENNTILFEHIDFSGRNLVVNPGQGYENLTQEDFNDKASSLCIPRGVTVELWEHSNFRGNNLTIKGPLVILNLVPRGWNDKISSIRIH